MHVRVALHSTFCSPYYIWLGRSRSCDVSRFCHAFEVESGNMIGNCSPASFGVIKDSKVIPLLDIGKSVVEVEPLVPAHSTISITPPLSSFHYHVGNVGSLSSCVSTLKESSFSPGDCRIMNNPCTRSLGRSFTRSHGWDLNVLERIGI